LKAYKFSWSCLGILSIVLIFIACQPKQVVRSDDPGTPDSVLYFQPIDISDPFLDTIFQDPDRNLALSKEVYPPPEPGRVQKGFKEIDGFRVQVAAATDSLNALDIRDQARLLTSDSIHLVFEKGLYKIQIGDYQFRHQADAQKTKMRQNGFPGAWVLQRRITIPVDSTDFTIDQGDTATVAKQLVTGKYKIQLIATGSRERAEEIISEMQTNTSYHIFYEPIGNLFKVFVGYFETEQAAREALAKIRNSGYPDAWLVY